MLKKIEEQVLTAKTPGGHEVEVSMYRWGGSNEPASVTVRCGSISLSKSERDVAQGESFLDAAMKDMDDTMETLSKYNAEMKKKVY